MIVRRQTRQTLVTSVVEAMTRVVAACPSRESRSRKCLHLYNTRCSYTSLSICSVKNIQHTTE